MKKSFKKSVPAFGIFASGLVVGYTATLLSDRSKQWYSQLSDRISQIKIPKILPAIPEFEKEQISIDVETQLGMNE